MAGGLILVALATVVLGAGIWAAYLRFLGEYVGSFDVFSVRPSVMWNLRGTLALVSGPDVSGGRAGNHQHPGTRRPTGPALAVVA